VQTLNLPGERSNLTGRVAQDFTLKTLDGAKITLSGLRGKVVLLGIDDEDIGTVEGFLKKNEYSLPVLMDVKREVHRMYGARAVPTMIAIDPSGVIQAHYIGGRGEDALVAAVRTAGLK
jgi:peroxiredoxin